MTPVAVVVARDRGQIASWLASLPRDAATVRLLPTEGGDQTAVGEAGDPPMVVVVAAPTGSPVPVPEPTDIIDLLDHRPWRGAGQPSGADAGTGDAPAACLTKREREVLHALAAGHPPAVIARELCVSQHTVRNHIRHLLAKLDAHTQLEAVAVAAREGIVDLGARRVDRPA